MECVCRGTTFQCLKLTSIYAVSVSAILLHNCSDNYRDSLGHFQKLFYLKMFFYRFYADTLEKSTFGLLSIILSLIIIGSHVRVVKTKTFTEMKILTNLDLRNNAIHEVHMYNFQGLESMEYLNLRNLNLNVLNTLSFMACKA